MTITIRTMFPALLLTGLAATLSAAPPDARAARPDFALPLPCGTSVRLTTYFGHRPDDKKIDFIYLDRGWRRAKLCAAAAWDLIADLRSAPAASLGVTGNRSEWTTS